MFLIKANHLVSLARKLIRAKTKWFRLSHEDHGLNRLVG